MHRALMDAKDMGMFEGRDYLRGSEDCHSYNEEEYMMLAVSYPAACPHNRGCRYMILSEGTLKAALIKHTSFSW